MTTKLTIDFTAPKHGWLQLDLRSGDQKLHVSVSQTPFDSLEELASAVSAFLETGRQGLVRINCEPVEYDLLLEPGSRPSSLRVKAIYYPRGRRAGAHEEVWRHESGAIQIGRTIWRAFRKLETRFASEHWIHAFPSKLVEGLDRLTVVAG